METLQDFCNYISSQNDAGCTLHVLILQKGPCNPCSPSLVSDPKAQRASVASVKLSQKRACLPRLQNRDPTNSRFMATPCKESGHTQVLVKTPQSEKFPAWLLFLKRLWCGEMLPQDWKGTSPCPGQAGLPSPPCSGATQVTAQLLLRAMTEDHADSIL